MDVSSSLGRTLFTRVNTNIVITEPVPLWLALVQLVLKGAAVALLGVACFYAGVLYERSHRDSGAGQAARPVASAAETGDHPLALVPEQMLLEVTEARRVDGLDIQTLDVVADRAAPNQLRYEFSVLNEGRRYEGTLEILVLGVQDGRPTQWVFPPQGQPENPAYRMRVGRYLKTTGAITVPDTITPQAMALRLREPSGIRASRGVILSADPAKAPLLPAVR
jgi:hypothetical protein